MRDRQRYVIFKYTTYGITINRLTRHRKIL